MWFKRNFDSIGVTQFKPGPYLEAVQANFGGSVVLCLDVSGSMSGDPLRQAIQGCERFIEEAKENHYSVGLVLWHHDIDEKVKIGASYRSIQKVLRSAQASGGNNICPTLSYAHSCLRDFPVVSDRVVAIFGDGDLGNPGEATKAAAPLVADNIRIITCGLGDQSASALDVISTESRDSARKADLSSLADDVAQMASALISKKTP